MEQALFSLVSALKVVGTTQRCKIHGAASWVMTLKLVLTTGRCFFSGAADDFGVVLDHGVLAVGHGTLPLARFGGVVDLMDVVTESELPLVPASGQQLVSIAIEADHSSSLDLPKLACSPRQAVRTSTTVSLLLESVLTRAQSAG